MNKVKNLRCIFHLSIIAVILFSFAGCGYKANPYYEQEVKEKEASTVPTSDENVEFKIKSDETDR